MPPQHTLINDLINTLCHHPAKTCSNNMNNKEISKKRIIPAYAAFATAAALFATALALFVPPALTSLDFATASALFATATAAALFVAAGPHKAAAALLVPGGPLRKRARALMHQCKVHKEVLVNEALSS